MELPKRKEVAEKRVCEFVLSLISLSLFLSPLTVSALSQRPRLYPSPLSCALYSLTGEALSPLSSRKDSHMSLTLSLLSSPPLFSPSLAIRSDPFSCTRRSTHISSRSRKILAIRAAKETSGSAEASKSTQLRRFESKGVSCCATLANDCAISRDFRFLAADGGCAATAEVNVCRLRSDIMMMV